MRVALHVEAAEAIRNRVASDPHGAVAEAKRLARKAAVEKRLAERHRRRAKRAWITFEEFKRNLESLGIEVIIESAPTPQGGASDIRGNQGTTI